MAEKQSIVYYVEDDDNIRDLTLYALQQASFEGHGFPEASAFFEACSQTTPDLILLDIMLPGTDGLQILAQVRADSTLAAVPVIMLTAKGTELDTVSGLDAGADDYLAKPFSMMELISRANALLRRANREPSTAARPATGKGEILHCGPIAMDEGAHKVTVDGQAVVLTLKEYDLLRTLMENSGLALTRSQLFESVWGSEFFGETRTVDVHMQTLRQKLDRIAPGTSTLIQTVRGVGYRMQP